MERVTSRRYQTANVQARVIRRYLACEVVLARPPSSLYKFRKFFLRHKLLISGLCVFLVLLVFLLGFMSLLLVREKKLRQNSDLLAADTLPNTYVHDGKPQEPEPMFLLALQLRRTL